MKACSKEFCFKTEKISLAQLHTKAVGVLKFSKAFAGECLGLG